jgi:hypothetical protein
MINKYASLTYPTKNRKLGTKVAVTNVTIQGSCPSTCPLRDNGCYAQLSFVGMHNTKLTKAWEDEGAPEPRTVARAEAALIRAYAQVVPQGTPLRLHVSGDARTNGAAKILAAACEAWPGPVWTYTHAWRTVDRESWGDKIIVWASCESDEDMAIARARGYRPSIVVTSHDGDRATNNEHDQKVIPCPNQTRGLSCQDCGLCWVDHPGAISFAVHGTGTKRVLKVLGEAA